MSSLLLNIAKLKLDRPDRFFFKINIYFFCGSPLAEIIYEFTTRFKYFFIRVVFGFDD